VKSGIIDPTKSCALASRTRPRSRRSYHTEAMIAEKPEKKAASAMPPGGMGDMDY